MRKLSLNELRKSVWKGKDLKKRYISKFVFLLSDLMFVFKAEEGSIGAAEQDIEYFEENKLVTRKVPLNFSPRSKIPLSFLAKVNCFLQTTFLPGSEFQV